VGTYSLTSKLYIDITSRHGCALLAYHA